MSVIQNMDQTQIQSSLSAEVDIYREAGEETLNKLLGIPYNQQIRTKASNQAINLIENSSLTQQQKYSQLIQLIWVDDENPNIYKALYKQAPQQLKRTFTILYHVQTQKQAEQNSH